MKQVNLRNSSTVLSHILILVLLCSGLVAFAATSALAKSRSGMRIVGKLTSPETSILGETPDGDYSVAVTHYTGKHERGDKAHLLTVTEINSHGEQVVVSEAAFPGLCHIHDFIQLNMGGFFLAGYILDMSDPKDPTNKLFVARIMPDGRKLWEKRLDAPFSCLGCQEKAMVAESTDGGLLVLYEINSWGDPDKGFRVIKLDGNGELEWDKIFPTWAVMQGNSPAGSNLSLNPLEFYNNIDGDGSPTKVVPADHGGFLIAGYLAQSMHSAWVRKIDGDGNTLWFKTYGGPSDQLVEMMPEENGEFVVAGLRLTENRNQMWIRRMDSNGNLLAESACGPSLFVLKGIIIRDIARTNEGGYVLAGEIEPSSMHTPNQSAWVMKLDRDLKEEWFKKIRIDGYVVCQSVAPTGGGEYLVSGYYGGEGFIDALWNLKKNNVAFLLKLQGDGKIKAPKYYTTVLMESHHYIFLPIRTVFWALGWIIGGP
ncbi:MAG: hypothetical protein A2V67_05695 [Deltaproteobacteria bacterium RBG_13_61_14]|nr:MAG: hypothetical protein A2V67_05695 [Deltaproteobacteria bacterium RBG_13_61_14]